MKKTKTLKHILSPGQVRAGEVQEKTRALQTEQLKAKIQQAESYVAPDGGADVTNPEVQFGRALPRAEVVRKLQKLNPNLLYAQSDNWPEFGGIYVHDYGVDDLTLKAIGKKHLCGIPHEFVSEFDVPIVVMEEVPDPTIIGHWITVPKLEEHIPGWRSTIMKLVRKGYINLAAAELEFEIYKGRSSEHWQRAVN